MNSEEDLAVAQLEREIAKSLRFASGLALVMGACFVVAAVVTSPFWWQVLACIGLSLFAVWASRSCEHRAEKLERTTEKEQDDGE